MNPQSSITPGVPSAGRYLFFGVAADAEPALTRKAVQALAVDDRITVGLGAPMIAHWGGVVDGLRTFPALSGPGVQVPSSQQALWFWLHGNDRGELVIRSNEISEALGHAFRLEHVVDAFKYGDAELGRDLTGYEDGTENPTGADMLDAAFVQDGPAGMQGSSFVAVQQWAHDLKRFSSYPVAEQDEIIGRRISDNSEIEDAPASAHVKRTEQESFTPHAIILRRSMPYAEPAGEGLMFVAFGNSLDAFEVQLRRMLGLEDGIPDALFRFSRAINGSYFWCPPVLQNRLDLSVFDSPGSKS